MFVCAYNEKFSLQNEYRYVSRKIAYHAAPRIVRHTSEDSTDTQAAA